MKTFLYFAGKPKDQHSNALAEDYIKRASRFSTCVMQEVNPAKFDPFARHPGAQTIFLDPAGRPFDSADVCAIFENAERHGTDLVFAVGGHDGLPEKWRTGASILFSLSPLTMPHELARAVIAEQIYRAFATLRNHPYPR